jgi:hypothetical protein
VIVVSIDNMSVLDEKMTLLSLLDAETYMEPVVDVFAFGVNVAVYVLPLPLKLLSVPPLTVINDSVNLVVDVFNVNVIVDVSSTVKLLLVDTIEQVIFVVLVSI